MTATMGGDGKSRPTFFLPRHAPVRPSPGRRPLRPGHFLESRFMRPAGITQDALARALGVSRRRVNELIRGRRGISPDTSVRLARYFGTDPRFWVALQVAWETHAAISRMSRDEADPRQGHIS
ncbi:MAG: HigA family addiction module antidote protein [Rhodocyclaceae bacterium]|nr:HigA family addiction module antidote protein [Rhodocyclaceae bacterium]